MSRIGLVADSVAVSVPHLEEGVGGIAALLRLDASIPVALAAPVYVPTRIDPITVEILHE
jgi:hypothetical protein